MHDRTSKSKPTEWLSRARTELQRDKKKTTILVLLLVVVGIVVGRMAVTSKLPGRARADAHAAASRVPPQAPLAERGRIGRTEREEYLAQMDRTITRDLFAPDPKLYPGAGSGQAGSSEGDSSGDGWFGQVGKWVESKQQAQSDEQAQIAMVQTEAQALRLRSIMLGSLPTALINDQVLRVGGEVSGFRLTKINSNSCTVVKHGVAVELRMTE